MGIEIAVQYKNFILPEKTIQISLRTKNKTSKMYKKIPNKMKLVKYIIKKYNISGHYIDLHS